ncbi:MAG: aquaporin family protein [Candidatus Omnitrophica bacterium]|nr:aquaporin family protein [Candidatus Omnitrophota bacterium]MDE2008694.1 aquaporin family protein [Candidatus Omnitrophota bacterium]MDE2214835.1 aquaporin family protein [Candidatus Omnitrophota bacterium]MDE2231955.1 aquaporin family protein [Candidatus Omnitrophota bacterium]
MNKYVMEFIGTFFLVFVVGLSVVGIGAGAMAPLAIGTILMVMVYAGGHISGGHYNPAVTLAVWMRGKCDTTDVPGYWTAQFIAAVVAALLVGYLKHGSLVIEAQPNMIHALLVELIFTFALAFVVLNVATSKGTAGNSFYGLAIGFTVMASAYAAGNISGGAFNPAVALGMTLMGLNKLAMLLIFWIGNFAGGALAAVTFKYLNPQE